MDDDRLADTIRRAAEQDQAATSELRDAVSQIAESLGAHIRRFKQTRAGVQKELHRGARLTKHKLTL